MNSFVNSAWIWFSDSDEDEEENQLHLVRRQFKMFERLDHFNKWDDVDFFRRFRLQKQTVAHILHLIQSKLEDKTERSRNVTPMAKLLITLRFYALGTMIVSVADFVGVCRTTAGKIIPQVTLAIALLRKDFINMPETESELTKASTAFYNFAKFPKTVGAMDCTHVRIQSPGGNDAEHFRNRKGYFSLNVQSVSSADLKFLNVVARWPGFCHDQTIFNNSLLKMKLERGDQKGYIIIADSGYANTPYLATPLAQCNNAVEQVYNESIIRSRNVVERKYGVWKRRFPILSLQMRMVIPTVQNIIVATAILHNIAIDEKEEVPPETTEVTIPPVEEFNVTSMDQDDVVNIRSNLLAEYFPSLIEANNTQ